MQAHPDNFNLVFDMPFKPIYIAIMAAGILLTACRQENAAPGKDWTTASWEEIVKAAQGTQVTFMHWQGDPYINRYLRQEVAPLVDSLYDINLQMLSGQGSKVVATVMAELEAGVAVSEIDMCWINGETFYQLRQIDGLYGPFVEKLPNNRFIDWGNPFIAKDFQQPVNFMECPWGNVQQTLIYDTMVMQSPPQNRHQLLAYAKAHPGTITIPSDFAGMSFLKALLVDIAGSAAPFQGAFDEKIYDKYTTQLWAYFDTLRPYLWKEGNTYPENVAQMHQLFANGALHLTMSMNDAEVDNKVAQGMFSPTCRAYVWASGTIQNSHYLGIAARSDNIPGAMVVINTMISPFLQWKKMDPTVWGDGTVLDVNRLPAPWPEKFATIPHRKFAPDRAVIQRNAIEEFAPEYMIRLYEDFRQQVIES